MKRILKKGLVVWIVLCLITGCIPVYGVQAASKNRKAGKAFARALATGKIKYPGKKYGRYGLCDIDGDGIKELVIEDSRISHYTFWTYKKGKVSKQIKFYAEFFLCYNKKTKTFWELGDGDGGWMNSYKRKGKKLKRAKTSYSIYGVSSNKWVAEKTVNGKTKKISKKKYDSMQKSIIKKDALKMAALNKPKLMQKLLRLK